MLRWTSEREGSPRSRRHVDRVFPVAKSGARTEASEPVATQSQKHYALSANSFQVARNNTASSRAVMKKNRVEIQCRAKGLRLTEQRRVIAEVLSHSRDHPDVAELHRRAQKRDDH